MTMITPHTRMTFFPSPREGGEKVPSASEADEGREEAPHPPRWRSAPSPRLRGEKDKE